MENIRYIGPTGEKENIYEGIQNSTIKEVCSFIDKSKVIAFDLETSGLDPHSSEVVMMQIGNENIQYVIDTRSVDVTPILPFLKAQSIKKVGSNLKFDYKMMLSNYGIRIQNLHDTMVTENVLYNGIVAKNQLGLKALAKKYLKFEMPKEVRLGFTRLHGRLFSLSEIIYGARDVEIPIIIYKKQLKKIRDEKMSVVTHLENSFVKVVAEKEYNGMYVDADKWMELFRLNSEEIHGSVEALDQYVRDYPLPQFLGTPSIFDNMTPVHINWSSPAQASKVFLALGLEECIKILDKEKTEKVKKKYRHVKDLKDHKVYKNTLSSDHLANFKDRHPFIELFLRFKKYQKAVSTYGEKYLETYLNPKTGRLHSDFWQIQNTGRLSSSKPNLQQIPSYKSKDRPSCEAHRTCFTSPEGWDLIVRDYSSCELRILAEYADEKDMQEEYASDDDDLHSLTASKVFTIKEKTPIVVNKSTNTHLRAIGKMLNFAIAYGASAFKISKSIGVSVQEGEDILGAFYSSYPALDKYFSKWRTFVKDHGYLIIDSYTNRKFYFSSYKRRISILEELEEYEYLSRKSRALDEEAPKRPKELYSELKKIEGSMERAAQNYRIQGTNASMTKIALIMMYNYLKDNNLFNDVKIVLSLHDELVLEAKEYISEKINLKLKEFMEEAGKLFCKKVPLKSDGGVTKVWDH